MKMDDSEARDDYVIQLEQENHHLHEEVYSMYMVYMHRAMVYTTIMFLGRAGERVRVRVRDELSRIQTLLKFEIRNWTRAPLYGKWKNV